MSSKNEFVLSQSLKYISIYCPNVVNVVLANSLNVAILTNYYFTAFTIDEQLQAKLEIEP